MLGSLFYLNGTNRDINATQEITRDQTTGMLDGSVTVDHRLLTDDGRKEIIQEQKNLPQNAEIIGKMTAAGVTSLGVATAALASKDQNLKQAYDTVMNPARTFDFIQKNPEAATVIEQFKSGDYDGLLKTKGSLQLLAQALGQDIDVLTTSITSFLGVKGAFDHQTNTVVLDVNQDNRSGVVDTFGHEIAHGQGIKNETSADLIGKTVDWAFDSGVKHNQSTINQYKNQLGDGKDETTQAQNQDILKKDNQIFIDNVADHPDEMDDKTSYKQSIANSLFCWNKECTEKFNKLDKAQEEAYRKGQNQAISKFVEDIKNIPNVPKEVYEAVKNDPKGTAIAILKGLSEIPGDIWDTTKIITKVNAVGDTPAEFEKLGNAETKAVLNTLSSAFSAGIVTLSVKAGKVVVIKSVIDNATIGTKIDKKVKLVEQAPLRPTVVESFQKGLYQTVITNENISVYRKFGGGSNQAKLNGGYATTEKNASRNDTAVYPSWSSSRFEAEIIIPKGQELNIGKVGQQPVNSNSPKYTGGADQILLPQNYSMSGVKSIKDGKTGKVYTYEEFKKAFPDQVKR